MNKPIEVVFLDIDGVLVDFVQGALDAHDSDLKPSDITSYDMAGIMGLTEAGFWRRLDEGGPEFWINLPVYPWFNGLLAGLRRVAKRIVLTTAPGFHYSGFEGKKRWIDQYFGAAYRDYIFTPRKHYLARTPSSVLVDDSPANVKAFRDAGGAAVLFPQPWNGHDGYGNEPPQDIVDYIVEGCLVETGNDSPLQLPIMGDDNA